MNCLSRRSFSFLVLTVLVGLSSKSGRADNILNVNQKMQEKDQWCWSASCQAVLEFYGINVSQSVIANYGTGSRNVPDYLWGWDNVWDNSAQIYYRKNGCDLILANFGNISASGFNGILSQSALTAEMDAGRPVFVNWQWSGTSNGHILIARGVKDGNVYLMDPYYGPTIGTYSWVTNGLTSGSTHIWQWTLKLSTASSTTNGVPRWWLGKYNLSTSGDWNALALADPDGDGVPTWAEYLADTDPTNESSRFVLNIHELAQSASQCVLSWQGSTNRVYSLQTKTNLSSSVPWVDVPGGTNLTGTGLGMVVTNSQTAQTRFYKINALPRN